ncbi:MAG TPA: hypothetical protein VER17_15210 [Tepidisphaeraceae bacterium]|nr:hypothetical protein [Tepidisphaeraceae bacterium]
MRRRPTLIAACAFLFLLAAASLPAIAQSSSALINEALDKQVKLNIANQTIPQATQTIANETGVRIDVDPQVWQLLPWGEQTTINAKIENQTLRGALQAITRKLGLTFELKDEAVELQPLPALRRLGRRANVDELAVLDLLSRTPLEAQADRVPVRQLLASVDAKLEAAKSPFAVENRAFGDDAGSLQVPVARNAMLLQALEAIPSSTEATWYPWGQTLVVRPKVDHMRDQLARAITVRFNGVDVSQVLAELQTRSGVPFVIEPGAVQRIAQDSRVIKLVLDNAPVQQALESIAGYTGLAWSVNNNGVYIWNPQQAGTAAREPTIGLLTLDNGVQVILRESQVPPDLREYVRHKTEQQFTKIREQMRDEGFKPTSRPTTAPAATQLGKGVDL